MVDKVWETEIMYWSLFYKMFLKRAYLFQITPVTNVRSSQIFQDNIQIVFALLNSGWILLSSIFQNDGKSKIRHVETMSTACA